MGKSEKPGESKSNPRVETIRIADLTPDPANVRRHTDRNKATVRSSLKRFGSGRSIVLDRDNCIIAGNQTIESAADLGMTEVVVVEVRPDQIVAVRKSDWTKTEAAGYALVDNRAAELAEWDFQGLAGQLGALQLDGFNLEDLGWAPHESGPLLAAEWTPPASGEMPSESGKTKEPHPYAVVFSPEAFAVVKRACDRVRELEGDDATDARAIELICADWINDPNWHGEAE